MPFVSVHGTSIHYRISGRQGAPRLVLANSLGSDLRIWDEVCQHLAPNFELLCYDKRGHGLSDVGDTPYSLSTLADDVLALMDAEDWQDAALIGVSVGGLIAQAVSVTAPQRVRGLVLLDTAAKIGTDASWSERITAIEDVGLPAMADAIASRWFSQGFAERSPAAFHGWRNMLARTPAAGYVATCAALRDADLREHVKHIRVPTLVLCGAEDAATTPALVEDTAKRIPGARFEVIAQTGHIPFLEQPQTIAGLIVTHMKDVYHG